MFFIGLLVGLVHRCIIGRGGRRIVRGGGEG